MSATPTLFDLRPLDDAVAEAHETVERARRAHKPTKTFLLFSGGNDSLVLLDGLASEIDAVVHVNTGIGIPQTNEFARKIGSQYGVPFIELHPPQTYEELVFGRWNGLPGPGLHGFVYDRLKGRCVGQLLRDHRTRRGERFLLLSGVRNAESKRRMGYKDAINRNGGQVWVNPLLSWSNQEMSAYRQAHSLPINEVAANLHMSGECLCGAMADQDDLRGERAAIRFFYPKFDARLSALEAECKRRGLRHCEWGVKRAEEPGAKLSPGQLAFEMCQSCEWRNSERGLA